MPCTRLKCVDGLRGVAILLIVLFHFRLMAEATAPRAALKTVLEIFREGGVGIHLFLVLSGFGLTYSRLSQRRPHARQGLVRHAFARWRRLAPPYYAALGLYLVTLVSQAVPHDGPIIEGGLTRQVLVHALFLHGFWPETIYAISTPLWFLSMLFQLYLIFPALLAIADRLGYRVAIPMFIAAALAWRAGLLWYWPDRAYLVNGLFLGHLPEFAIGMAIAAWYQRPGPAGDFRALALIALLGSSATALSLLAVQSRQPLGVFTDVCWAAAFGSMLVAILSSNRRDGTLARVWAAAPLVWMGDIGYSLYLTHALVLGFAAAIYRRLPLPNTETVDDLYLLIAFGTILALGWGFFRLVEQPLTPARNRQLPPARPREPLDEPEPVFAEQAAAR